MGIRQLEKDINAIFDKYNECREVASKILEISGMEEAIIDELRDRGFEVVDDEY